MLQIHIEQGPVLEWLGFPLGVVKGIAGQTRLKVYEPVPVLISISSQDHFHNQNVSRFKISSLISPNIQLQVTVRGSQGHAGTVPMSMRQDPMTAAAELIVLMENLCKNPEDFLSYDGHCNDITVESLSSSLVCTVGEISTWPSASNVIPGQVRDLSFKPNFILS